MKLPLSIAVCFACAGLVGADEAADAKFFNEKILTVFKKHCFECHSKDADELKGKLRLDTKAGLKAGGGTGEIVKPGEPDDSLIIKVLRYDEDDRQMPPRGKLDQAIIDDFVEWVKNGAFDPRKE
jgi:mono/diheme cytochrome c family protein